MNVERRLALTPPRFTYFCSTKVYNWVRGKEQEEEEETKDKEEEHKHKRGKKEQTKVNLLLLKRTFVEATLTHTERGKDCINKGCSSPTAQFRHGWKNNNKK